MELPVISDKQSWCCEKGCGTCQPVQVDFECSRTENIETGEVVARDVQKVWVSHCCHADLALWDDDADGFVEVPDTAVEHAGPPGQG